MAVNVALVNSTGEHTADGFRLTETWHVDESDPSAACTTLGPLAVLGTAGLPKRGQAYAETCDDAGSIGGMICDKVRVGDKVQLGEDLCRRIVTVEYRQLTASLPGGFPQAGFDPLTWHPHVEVFEVTEVITAEQLLFLGGYTYDPNKNLLMPCQTPQPTVTLEDVINSAVNRVMGKVAPVASTAGEPFNPAEEIEVSYPGFRVTTFTSSYDASDVYQCYSGGAINDSAITIDIPELNFSKSFPKHTLKMSGIQPRAQYAKWQDGTGTELSRSYWAVAFEMVFKWHGHYIDKFNVGTKTVHRGNGANEADGFGGEFNYNSDFPTKRSPIGAILDAHDLPSGRPQFLNKQGDPIHESQNPYVLRYLDGWEADFTAAGLGLPILVV